MIPSGYKQTEIGVIPEDWGVIPFSKCFDTINNNTLSRAELNYDGGNIRNIHYGDVLINFPSIVDCQKETIPYINEDAADGVGNSFLQDGDVVIADTAEDNTVGKAVEIFNIGDSKVVAGLHTMPCRPKYKFAGKYLGYYINGRVFHEQIIPFITGTKVSAISKKAIDNTLILIPPIPEQRRIAEALSDIDELITSLEKLIEKKKALKQGVMQELLTGKRRLPGFTGEWKVREMKDYVDFQVGFPFSSSFFNDNSVGLRLIRNRDLKSDDQIVFSSELINNSYIVENGDLLVGMDGDFTPCIWNKGRALLNQRVGRLFFSDSMIDMFAYFAFQKPLMELQGGIGATTVKHLSHGDIKKLKVLIPPTREEQRAVASVLTNLDEELQQYTEQKNKVCQIKQGMMSELLTGRIRLLDERS